MRSIPEYGSAEWAEAKRQSEERARERRIEEAGPALLVALRACLSQLRLFNPAGDAISRNAERAIEKATGAKP